MAKNKETVIQRFWSRVFNSPDKTGVLVRNPNRTPQVFYAPAHGGAPGAAVVHPDPYVGVSWADCGWRVASIMTYMISRGFKKGDRAAILSWNTPEWVWCDMAIQSLGGISVAIYPNSASEQVNYLLKDSGSTFIFASDEAQLEKVDASSKIERVLFQEPKAPISGVTTFSYITAKYYPDNTLRHLQQQLSNPDPAGFCGIGYDDVATLIYTSGSTGVPKGVILTHGNFATECESIGRHGLVLGEDDIYLSYLPLAHVFERLMGGNMCAWYGVPTAFCRVEEMADAIKLVRPTILVGVPAVWRKIKDKIQSQLAAATGIKSKLVRWAFKQTKPGFGRWLADVLVFKKIRAGLGGRLRICMTGGAPISPEILTFYDEVGLTLLQGYGLTETTAGLTVNTPDANRIGSVGRTIDAVELKIVPEPGSEGDSGEIVVRGKTVTRGYWNLEAETNKTMTADGWFKTGDLGRLDADGYLYITGRKKRLMKTDGGKYVAPEKIEKAVDGDALIQCIVPVGDGKPFISALVFVNQINARDFLKAKGIEVADGDAAAFIASHPEILKGVEAGVAAANAKLEQWETVKKFIIVPVEASVANGLLTATMKIRSEEAVKRYGDLAEAMYVKRS